jgi:putative oxidoreductase
MRNKTVVRILSSEGPAAMLFVRLAVGFVFLISGAVKFLYENQGEVRFLKLGFAAPEATAYFVGGVEIAAGTLLVVGLITRLAAFSLAIDMLVAIFVSKLPLLFGAGPEPVAAAPKTGLWAFAYVARLDLTMLLLAGFLVVVGAGAVSLDSWLVRRLTAGQDDRYDAELPARAA